MVCESRGSQIRGRSYVQAQASIALHVGIASGLCCRLVVITTGQSGVTDHGFGVGPFLDLSMPAGLLGFLAAALFHAEWLLVPVCFLSALAQYALLGYGIDSFLRRRKQRRMDRSAKGG